MSHSPLVGRQPDVHYTPPMTTIDDLIRLVPPPAEPVGAIGDWQRVEADLGLRLPADFKALIERYGLGQFVDFITPLTPFGPRDLLVQSAHRLLDSERSFRRTHPDKCPYPFYPEPGGLLEWAATDNGDRLCWLTGGEPDSWTTVVWNPRGWYYEAHDLSAVEFLLAWLNGQVTTSVFPDAEAPTPWFEPLIERDQVYIKLSEGKRPYPERLRILRDALAPTADRGGYDDGEGDRQDHFSATELGWNLTYETAYGHQIRVAFPPHDADRARTILFAAVRRMGCKVLTTTTHLGQPTWT